ncbi:MAG: outer membrane beta-barrel protein [Lentimicrobium sp.]
MKYSKFILTLLFAGICCNLMSQMQINSHLAGSASCFKGYEQNPTLLSHESETTNETPFYGIKLKNTGSCPAGPTMPPPSVNLTGKSLFLNVHAGSTSVYNKDLFNSDWIINTTPGYQAEFGFSKRINKVLTYGFGVGFSSYNSEISSTSLTETHIGTDLEGVLPDDPVERRVNYLDVTEKVNLAYIDIPVFLEFGNTNYDKAGFFIQLGIKLSFPVFQQFNGSGTYNVNGYYSGYEVEIQNVPELGFVQGDPLFNDDPALSLTSYNISGAVSGGISFPLGEIFIIRISADYMLGLTDISDTGNNQEDYQFQNVSHILGNESSPTYLRSFGGAIGIIYQLTVK